MSFIPLPFPPCRIELCNKEAGGSQALITGFKTLMDLETENRIAAILLKEAAEMRRRAEKEGIHVYLEKPQVRGRPNSRFLTATILGVQQANRAVEVNEMWRAREKEIELEDRLRGRSRRENDSCIKERDVEVSSDGRSWRESHTLDNKHASTSYSSRNMMREHIYSRQPDGLKDAEIEEFLHSRVKRGRGAVGSRMDETGPHLPSSADYKNKHTSDFDTREHHVALGPEKPLSLKSPECFEEEIDEDKPRKVRKIHSSSSDKRSHSRKHKSKEKSRDKRKRKKKKSRH